MILNDTPTHFFLFPLPLHLDLCKSMFKNQLQIILWLHALSLITSSVPLKESFEVNTHASVVYFYRQKGALCFLHFFTHSEAKKGKKLVKRGKTGEKHIWTSDTPSLFKIDNTGLVLNLGP